MGASGQTGGCQCGAIRYRLLRAMETLYACHCRDCQKQSASAFGLSMLVERNAVAFSGPAPGTFSTRGDSGRIKICAFCCACGTRLFHASGGLPGGEREVLSIKAGTLDDTSALNPCCHIWTSRAQPWMAALLRGEPCFAEGPVSDEALRALWRESGGSVPGDA